MQSKSFTRYNKPVSIPKDYEKMVQMLIDARYEQGLSQEKLAYEIGCTVSLIHKWERHKRIPSGFMLLCWLEALGYEMQIKKTRKDNLHIV